MACCGTHPNADKSVEFKGFAAMEPLDVVKAPLKPWSYHPRPLGPDDVDIEITHCGICYSDIHTATDKWGGHASFPCIVGHEIVGTAIAVGPNVRRIRVGDRVGVGAQVGACLECEQCLAGKEQHCTKTVYTYGSSYPDGQKAQGGYAQRVRVHSHFTFVIPDAIESAVAAPLLCAGATVWAPLLRYGCGPGMKVGVIGIGGLGHLAVQFAHKMGAEVTCISSSNAKMEDSKKLGAVKYINSTDKAQMAAAFRTLDLIVLTANFDFDKNISSWLSLTKVGGKFVTVALPEAPMAIPAFSMMGNEVSFIASSIGSHSDIISMLKFAAKHDVKPWVDVMPLHKCNEAIALVQANKPRFRIVLDTKQFEA